MPFANEREFEDAMIKALARHGWEDKTLENYSEDQLIANWADILFENNRGIDRLDNYPLTGGEMRQILEQMALLKTPKKLNDFINGRSVAQWLDSLVWRREGRAIFQ